MKIESINSFEILTTILFAGDIFTGRNEVVAKVLFLHVCVILFTGGVSPGRPPRDLAGRTPPPDLAGRTPPDLAGRPPTRDLAGRPPRDLAGRPPPPREEDYSIRSMSGRYASYWNAFLYLHVMGLSPIL